MLTKILSGGQMGADLAGLLAASFCGIETSGWIPKGFKTETGERPSLKRFGLRETISSDYDQRTQWNIRESTGTLIIASNFSSPGTAMTIKFCKDPLIQKPYYCVSYIPGDDFFPREDWRVGEVVEWIQQQKIKILNVAGNRLSKSPGIQVWSTKFLIEIFQRLKGKVSENS